MALFGRDYGDDYGYRGRTWGGYDRGYTARDRGPYSGYRGEQRDVGWRGYGTDYRDYGYDRNYKSRWQTDMGDPFGDRESHTPIRVLRGPYEARDYGRDYYGRDYETRRTYDRGYMRNPMSYEPYGGTGTTGRTRGWNAGGTGRYGSYSRGYDRGWF